MPGCRSLGMPSPRVAFACGSTSASSVLQPASAMQAATLTAVVVFPTPPFWLAIAYTVPMEATTLATRTVGRGLAASERPLERHSGAARKAIGGGRDLADEYERRRAGAWIRLDRADLRRREAQVRGCEPAGLGLGGIEVPLPGHEDALVAQQRRSVLAEHGQRGERPGRHDVLGAEPVPPFLRARVNHRDVHEPRRLDRALEVASGAAGTLDERDVAVGKRRCEREPGPPRAGAEVREPVCGADLLELQRDERVGDVAVDSFGRVADGGRGVFVGGLVLEEGAEGGDGALVQPVAGCELVETFHVKHRHRARKGFTWNAGSAYAFHVKHSASCDSVRGRGRGRGERPGGSRRTSRRYALSGATTRWRSGS